MPPARRPFVIIKRKSIPMAWLDRVAEEAFKRNPFNHRVGELVPIKAIKPLAHWLLVQYMTKAGLKPAAKIQIIRLVKMVESKSIESGYGFPKTREEFEKIGKIGFVKDPSGLVEAIINIKAIIDVSQENRNLRPTYQESLAKMPSKKRKAALEKTHMVEDAEFFLDRQLTNTRLLLSHYIKAKRYYQPHP